MKISFKKLDNVVTYAALICMIDSSLHLTCNNIRPFQKGENCKAIPSLRSFSRKHNNNRVREFRYNYIFSRTRWEKWEELRPLCNNTVRFLLSV